MDNIEEDVRKAEAFAKKAEEFAEKRDSIYNSTPAERDLRENSHSLKACYNALMAVYYQNKVFLRKQTAPEEQD